MRIALTIVAVLMLASCSYLDDSDAVLTIDNDTTIAGRSVDLEPGDYRVIITIANAAIGDVIVVSVIQPAGTAVDVANAEVANAGDWELTARFSASQRGTHQVIVLTMVPEWRVEFTPAD